MPATSASAEPLPCRTCCSSAATLARLQGAASSHLLGVGTDLEAALALALTCGLHVASAAGWTRSSRPSAAPVGSHRSLLRSGSSCHCRRCSSGCCQCSTLGCSPHRSRLRQCGLRLQRLRPTLTLRRVMLRTCRGIAERRSCQSSQGHVGIGSLLLRGVRRHRAGYQGHSDVQETTWQPLQRYPAFEAIRKEVLAPKQRLPLCSGPEETLVKDPKLEGFALEPGLDLMDLVPNRLQRPRDR
mmetsp:Transcript_8666/g.18962  ORF Transcript_8666/g.18962 Transcript_8666/m.18962 type:complete len:242 (+) Transcript_8666:63-788(+)